MSKFENWIASQGGATKVARLLKVERVTVYAWIDGRATPKALLMQKIVRISKGALTYDCIIDSTKKQNKKESRA